MNLKINDEIKWGADGFKPVWAVKQVLKTDGFRPIGRAKGRPPVLWRLHQNGELVVINQLTFTEKVIDLIDLSTTSTSSLTRDDVIAFVIDDGYEWGEQPEWRKV